MTFLTARVFEFSNWIADLVRVSQGVDMSKLLGQLTKQSVVTESIRLSYNETIVGHVSSLDDLKRYINNHCKNSFKVESVRRPTRMFLKETAEAVGQVKKQCSSADEYAFLRVGVSPRFDTSEIRLSIPTKKAVAKQLHHSIIAEAILDGIMIASCTAIPGSLVTGYEVRVLEGKYHDVDSHAGVFKNATRAAISEILRGQYSA